MSTNKNCTNVENCNYCNYCDYCNYCNSCNSCNSCNYCNSCYYCYSCNSCDYCYSCNSCYYCYSCNYCNSCNSCNYCDSCNSCYSCYYCYSCDYCNYCYYSIGLRLSERMIFCLGEGRYAIKGEGYQKNNRIFNKDVSEVEFNKARDSRPEFKLPIAKWVEKNDMTDAEKKNWKSYTETGGFLKTLSYEDAWAEAWPKASEDFKQWVLSLPNFNAKLFKEITGQDIEATLVGQEAEVTIGGKKYKATITSESH